MKRDPRPIWQQVLSGFKITAVILAIGAGALVCFSLIPRYRIAAYFWHLRHGNTIEFARHRIPVPKEWYPWDKSFDSVNLIDVYTGDSVVLSVDASATPRTLSVWSDVMTHPRHEMKPIDQHIFQKKTIGQRAFHVSGETFLCIEQRFDIKATQLYLISCRSDGVVQVNFYPYLNVGKRHDEAFYKLLQSIQKL